MAATATLRELAHGIHPAILTEAGLAAAVRSLVDTAPVPVVLDAPTDARFDPAVERATYSFVATAIEAAACDGPEELLVRLLPEASRLLVEFTGVTHTPGADLEHVTDHLGAVGDRLVEEDGSLVRAPHRGASTAPSWRVAPPPPGIVRRYVIPSRQWVR